MYYPTITLCGSTKFKEDFLRVQKELTLEGNIVISVGLFGHSGDSEVDDENTKRMLDDMHLKKIDMCDIVYVINKDGYIGESTKREIAYALSIGREVEFMEPLESCDHRLDELLDSYPDLDSLRSNREISDEILSDIRDAGKDISLSDFCKATRLTPAKLDRMRDLANADYSCNKACCYDIDSCFKDCASCKWFRSTDYCYEGHKLILDLVDLLHFAAFCK